MELVRAKLANGIELDCYDEGPRDAPPLIFLHGFPENARTWRHQIAHFSGHYRCIAPDQRGYRGSSRPEAVEDYSPDKIVGDVFLLADALGLETFTIVGHDWGGAIAWGVAMGGQMTGRVTRAIIMNAPHHAIFPRLLWTSRIQREASQYMRAFRDTAHDQAIRERGLEPFLRAQTGWNEPERMEQKEREALLGEWADGEAGIAMLSWYRASPVHVPPPDAPYQLPADWAAPQVPPLTIPTLVIWALDDTALPPENLEGMDRLIEDFTLVEVPDCGHFVQWEKPDAVNAAMEAFLARTA